MAFCSSPAIENWLLSFRDDVQLNLHLNLPEAVQRSRYGNVHSSWHLVDCFSVIVLEIQYLPSAIQLPGKLNHD